MNAPHESDSRYELQCMDIWSGNRSVENAASTPGMDIFVYSAPYRGESRGGDVHYVSLCAGGVVTRLILADVAGHGEAVAATSRTLRSVMRRFMNSKRQESLVRSLNREFTQLEQSGRFATAIVATYQSHRHRFTLCNAGHPRPLWYQRATEQWTYVSHELAETGQALNLPLGLDEAAQYQQFDLPVEEGDMLVLYTDALTEAGNVEGKLLGEEGLLKITQRVPTGDVRHFGSDLLAGVRQYSGDTPSDDDTTLLVLKFSAGRTQTPGIDEKLNAYAKVLGLKAV